MKLKITILALCFLIFQCWVDYTVIQQNEQDQIFEECNEVIENQRLIQDEYMPEPTYDFLLTNDELILIASVCHYEDGIHGKVGIQAVASTIKNRLDDGRFGNSITEVCNPKQFHGLRNIGKEKIPDYTYDCVIEVFCGEATHEGLYFCTPATNPDNIKGGLIETAQIGGHVYYKEVSNES